MKILNFINLSCLLVLLFSFINLHSQIKDIDTNTVFISYSNEINGYSVKVTWKPQESRISHIIGPAIIQFSQKDNSVVFYISSNIFGVLNSKLPFGSSDGKINTSGHKYITLKYDENATEKDEYFGTDSEPFFFQDIDFDNEKELIISEVGNGQRFYPSYRVYKYNDYAVSSYALFEPVYEKPYTLLDGLSEIDYINKQIVISKSGGACGAEYDYYNFYPSKSTSDVGTFVLEKTIELNLDDSSGKCYQYEYKVINQTKQLVSKKEKPVQNDSTENHQKLVKSESIIPQNLNTFLKKEMPGWKLVSKKQWLAEDYINLYFDDGTGREKTAYDKNIFIKGDFNGDKKDDYACFLMNSANNNIMLFAFHQNENGFDKFKISDEGPLGEEECCLGAGLDVQEPALIENAFYDKNYPENGVKKVDLKYNGIVYSLYEKSSQLFFFDGKKYSSLFLSD